MKRRNCIIAVFFCVCILSCDLFAGETPEKRSLEELFTYSMGVSGWEIKLGGEYRMRYETFEREVVTPDGTQPSGPSNKYLRMQGKIGLTFRNPRVPVEANIRFANRWHRYGSSPSHPNNDGAGTWEFPDETVVDSLNIKFTDVLGKGMDIVVGRQDFFAGSGLWMGDGVPYVQSRSAFHDGITLRCKNEVMEAALFSFYDTWKDGSVMINDRNRRLRLGNIFTAGAFFSRSFSPACKVELYYMYNDVEDKHWGQVRNHPEDANMSLHTAGLRLLGRPWESWGYDVELAKQAGRNAGGGNNSGTMANLKLRWYAPEHLAKGVEAALQYLYFSGDDCKTGKNEGWVPLMAEYPILREELIPIMLNGNWTNMHIERAELKLPVTDNVKLTFAAALLQADTVNTPLCTGGNSSMGTLLSAFLDVKLTDNLSFALEAAQFTPGNFWSNGHSSTWTRAELKLQF